jgi:integrase
MRKSSTLQELYDLYTEQHTKLRATERTRVTDESRFDTCFEDWKSRKIATIRPSHVREKHAEIARKRGNVTANRAIQLLRRMFNWARISPNPAATGEVQMFEESSRDRFLHADELPKFFAALEAEPNITMRDFFKLALLTGARRSNVESMRWDEINMDRATWTVPAEKSKSGEKMDVHLSAPAIELIKTRKEGSKSEWVFPSRAKCGHVVEVKSAWQRILLAAKIKDLRLHDLRRTLGSWQAATGASLHVIGKSLGHHDVATTAIYARLNLDPVRVSVDAATVAMMAAKDAKPEEKK